MAEDSNGIPIFGVKNDAFIPQTWTHYAKIISLSFNLFLKWFIIRNLIELMKLYSDPSECETFSKLWVGVPKSDYIVRQQMLAMQAISSTMELTENFADMCFAYAEAVRCGTKFFPLLIRDFGHQGKMNRYRGTKVRISLGSTDRLYKAMFENGEILKEYLACKEDPTRTISDKRRVISNIRKFRLKYVNWYNRFKHSHAVIPITSIFDVPGGFSALHRIPDHITWNDKMVKFRDKKLLASTRRSVVSQTLGMDVGQLDSDSVLTAYQNIDDVMQILAMLENFWQPIRATQHYALFKEKLPTSQP